MRRCVDRLPLILAALAVAGAARPGREAAEIGVLKRDLLSSPSATLVLAQWCADHHLAEPARISALRQRDIKKPADARVRHALHADPLEPLLYRRVNLTCGGHVLSKADNWYRPRLLTAEMNRRLETTDAPFGLVVAPLNFHRRVLRVTRATEARDVLLLRAVLISAGGAPFALVQETYTDEILARSPIGTPRSADHW